MVGVRATHRASDIGDVEIRKGLITWYRRMQRRQAVFDQGCGVDIVAVQPVLLLTTPATASRLAGTCGLERFRDESWVLLNATR